MEHLSGEDSVFSARTGEFEYFTPTFCSGINQKYFNKNVITFPSFQLLIKGYFLLIGNTYLEGSERQKQSLAYVFEYCSQLMELFGKD